MFKMFICLSVSGDSLNPPAASHTAVTGITSANGSDLSKLTMGTELYHKQDAKITVMVTAKRKRKYC